MTEGDGSVAGDVTDTERPVEQSSDGTLARLYDLQRDPRRRRLATAVALGLGLLLATVHWAGLLAGGALVGLSRPTLRRALAAGFGFGVLVLVVTAARFALAGTLGAVLATWPLVGVGVAIPLVAGPLGALARGLVRDAPLER